MPNARRESKSHIYFLLITFALYLAIYRKYHIEFIHEQNQEYYRLLTGIFKANGNESLGLTSLLLFMK